MMTLVGDVALSSLFRLTAATDLRTPQRLYRAGGGCADLAVWTARRRTVAFA